MKFQTARNADGQVKAACETKEGLAESRKPPFVQAIPDGIT